MDRTWALLQYWRNSLADVVLRSPVVLEGRAFPISAKEVVGESLPAQLTEKIFRSVERERAERRRKKTVHEADPRLSTVPLLVAPFTIVRRFQHGKVGRGEVKRYFPLWIPALVRRDCSLLGVAQSFPWISRECLEPSAGDAPVIGSLDDFDHFLESRAAPEGTDWTSARSYAVEMLREVMGCKPSDLQLEGFEVLDQTGIVLIHGEERGAAKELIKLYDEILAQDGSPLPPLLHTLTSGAKPSAAPAPEDLQASAPRWHCGQMNEAFPLSSSQRQAVHCLLSMPEGKLLAVNGPPGTGKTTLLQSVIASLWVERALADGEPPVILACSTNNQAVTNILDSFAAVASQRGNPLAERWLPDLDSYGLYMPSAERFREDKRYQKALSGTPWQGLPELMESSAYVERAEAHFKLSAHSVLPSGRSRSVEEIVRYLHEQLTVARDRLSNCIGDAQTIVERRRQHGCGDGGEARRCLLDEHKALNSRIAEERALHDEILAAQEQSPFWEILLGFLPPVRRHREARLSMPFLRRRRELPPVDGPDFGKALRECVEASLKALEIQQGELNRWEEAETRFDSRLEEVLAERPDSAALRQESLNHPVRVLDALDCSLRYRLFLLAGRYWEGRWLLEMKKLLGSGQRLDKQNRLACEERFRRFAKLTPCLVATLYRAPKVFDFFDPEREGSAPLLGFLDLLIVDEAGQVTPEVGAAVFSLARRALLVGDVHQIEPVWGISPAIDRANLREVGIMPEAGDDEDAIAHRSSRGSLMLLARRATAFTCDDDRGLFLREHRRCVPEIVRYCNELVYEGRLQPLRPPKRERILPALGWAHITSPEERVAGSRSNPGEARAIADWLTRHREELERHYGNVSIEEVVTVITPFAAQKRALTLAFDEQGLPEIKSGTVHAFQGAESPVVLFSPVYSLASEDKAPARLFFDNGSNLLNVAASRAKDSFLVFGDLRLFDRNKPALPSGKLARLLFELPDNEIADVESAQHLARLGDVDRITTLERHREILRRALTESRDRLLLVSPFLSPNAVDADEIPAAVAAARSRGVQVCVVYSVDLNRGRGRAGASQAADYLRDAGAEVVASDRIHSKTLAVDHAWIVEGSFNWLSATRDGGSPHRRREASLLYQGLEAERFIRNAWRDVIGAESG